MGNLRSARRAPAARPRLARQRVGLATAPGGQRAARARRAPMSGECRANVAPVGATRRGGPRRQPRDRSARNFHTETRTPSGTAWGVKNRPSYATLRATPPPALWFANSFLLGSHFSLVANRRRGSVNRSPQGAIRGGFAVSPRKSERFARSTSCDGAPASARRERRASSMGAAWDGSPALCPVPWGERSREAFNCVPGDQQSAPLVSSFGAASTAGLLIVEAKACEARLTVQARRRREPSARGSRVGVVAAVGGPVERWGPSGRAARGPTPAPSEQACGYPRAMDVARKRT
jgi:hypothetical protein